MQETCGRCLEVGLTDFCLFCPRGASQRPLTCFHRSIHDFGAYPAHNFLTWRCASVLTAFILPMERSGRLQGCRLQRLQSGFAAYHQRACLGVISHNGRNHPLSLIQQAMTRLRAMVRNTRLPHCRLAAAGHDPFVTNGQDYTTAAGIGRPQDRGCAIKAGHQSLARHSSFPYITDHTFIHGWCGHTFQEAPIPDCFHSPGASVPARVEDVLLTEQNFRS